jgi:serine/threonine protein kinase
MSKAKIIYKKSIASILGEKKILSELNHPFIVNMIYSFQDLDYLYLVMELLSGGNLRYHLSIKKVFLENQIKFIIGCIMLGLKYIHGQNILHRDIKPENLVFDSNGYLRITDFGIAKHYEINNKKDTSGTVGYLAPEVLCNVNHNFCIDYYAVGIITYELMFGHRPYLGKNKHEVKQLILTKQARIDINDLPDNFNPEIADFINKLIQRKPKYRLGRNDINEVLNHSWFVGFDWDNCSKKILKAPYIPKIGDNFDKNFCLQSDKIGTETVERYEKIMSQNKIHLLFKEFNCNKIPRELKGFNNKIKNENKHTNNINISSNMSSTSISRNNKNENNNLANKNMKYIIKNEIKNKIFNNDIGNFIAKNKNNDINDININNKNIIDSKKTYRNEINEYKNKNKNNYLDKSSINQNNNYNNNHSVYIIQKSNMNDDNEKEKEKINEILEKKILINNSIIKKKEPQYRNASARNLNRNRLKFLFNKSTTIQRNLKNDFNSSILKNIKKQELNSYKNVKNTSIIFNGNDSNLYNNKINSKNIYLKNKKNASISISKTKRDFIKKGLLRNRTIYFPNNNNLNFSNININNKKSTSVLMSSTIYSRKKNNSLEHSRINSKHLSSINSMENLNENNNYRVKEGIIKKKYLYENRVNSSRASKNILANEKNLPFLSLSLNKKNGIENSEGKDIYFKINKHKDNTKREYIKDKTRNRLNYDFLSERIKNKKMKTVQKFK